MWITTKCGKFLKTWKYQNTLLVTWETHMQVKKQPLELDMGQMTGSKLGKEYNKTVYCHPVYLTYMQYIMWNTGLDESQAGIKIPRRNINNFRFAYQVSIEVKNPSASVVDGRDISLIPGSGRSPGVGNGNLLQYSCLGNPMDRGAWQATVHGVAESWTLGQLTLSLFQICRWHYPNGRKQRGTKEPLDEGERGEW